MRREGLFFIFNIILNHKNCERAECDECENLSPVSPPPFFSSNERGVKTIRSLQMKLIFILSTLALACLLVSAKTTEEDDTVVTEAISKVLDDIISLPPKDIEKHFHALKRFCSTRFLKLVKNASLKQVKAGIKKRMQFDKVLERFEEKQEQKSRSSDIVVRNEKDNEVDAFLSEVCFLLLTPRLLLLQLKIQISQRSSRRTKIRSL
jgi:hypothetical protein